MSIPFFPDRRRRKAAPAVTATATATMVSVLCPCRKSMAARYRASEISGRVWLGYCLTGEWILEVAKRR